ncbi:transmembrane amino acid transporter protein-domain-containing protein [Dioszegia hungarica]|uniref:Transmembrane amino acid transporter protein-domain-containing protein n=1 Tax=Dioszegia hungarica TaxID=4972 RepID=A0AA38H095_9TREE|nr:transmembrane amino acid transporter protein-domain-containing protein [Dioszegia hungarica]KAI9631808.1 transmembrane amino acid transporter protein-domain-containing protein [Dioszegia hungarica]
MSSYTPKSTIPQPRRKSSNPAMNPSNSPSAGSPIPNIPSRSPNTTPAPGAGAGAGAGSFRPSSMSLSSRPNSARPTPKASIEGLGGKISPAAMASAAGRSGLTAQLGSSPSPSPAVGDNSRRGSMAQALRPAYISHPSGSSTPGAGDSSFSGVADVREEDKMKVLRRHLVSAEERGSTGGSGSGENTPDAGMSGVSRAGQGQGQGQGEEESGQVQEDEAFVIPYDAPGMDVTHDLYKWQQDHQRTTGGPQRSASFSHLPTDRTSTIDPSLAHIREPGGFRRNFVVNKAQEQGLEPPTLVRNVVDFLFLYGHFAGEDLDEDEDDDEEDEEEDEDEAGEGQDDLSNLPTARQVENGSVSTREVSRSPLSRAGTSRSVARDRGVSGERQPLLGRKSTAGPGTLQRSKSRHRRMKSSTGEGTASFTQAVLMLLKGFVGTGVLFMGKAFFNGGLLFSLIVLLALAGISLWAFLLLVQAYLAVPGSFGDIGGALYGKWMRFAILASIAVSQIGFVAVYTVFIAENLQAFILAVTDCKTFIATKWLIAAQLSVFMPLAMIRNLAKLSGTALIADVFILVGIVYIMGNETVLLATKGVADVAAFNPTNFPLFIGTAVFTFEGIGLVIPITESMREPHRFPRALSGVMIVVTVLFATAGIMGYAAYGSKIQTVVIVNLPQEDKFVQAVQFLYSIAILLSIPLQLFPAVRIMENGIFSRSGKYNASVKWQKNMFRGVIVLGCSLLSWAGSQQLDKFVSLVGSFACIPLCFIYPPLLHLRACAKTRKAKFLDISLIIFGVAICLYTTVQTLRSLFDPAGPPPTYGKCTVPV